jgi:hypothetical protein
MICSAWVVWVYTEKMHAKLIGYLLGALEVEETAYLEEALEADAEARGQLELLRLGLIPLEGDRRQVEAPVGLATGTCQQIGKLRDAEGCS